MQQIVVRINYRSQPIIEMMETLSRRELALPFKQTTVDAAKIAKATYAQIVPRSNGPGPHLADSIGILSRTYKNGLGAYSVVGEKIVNGRTMVKNYHAMEEGTAPRFRKRIGGKFAWVENVIANAPESLKRHKRRTEYVAARHYMQQAFNASIPAMINALEAGVRQRLMVMWSDRNMVPT